MIFGWAMDLVGARVQSRIIPDIQHLSLFPQASRNVDWALGMGTFCCGAQVVTTIVTILVTIIVTVIIITIIIAIIITRIVTTIVASDS